MRSPVLTSMSYSRGGWVALTELARWIRSSVVLPMALTTATTSEPWRRVRAMWSATARIRSASPTEVPPNFWTTSGIRTRLQTAHGRLATRPPRPAPGSRRCGRLRARRAIRGDPGDWVGSRAVPSDKRARQRAAGRPGWPPRPSAKAAASRSATASSSWSWPASSSASSSCRLATTTTSRPVQVDHAPRRRRRPARRQAAGRPTRSPSRPGARPARRPGQHPEVPVGARP